MKNIDENNIKGIGVVCGVIVGILAIGVIVSLCVIVRCLL